MAHINRKYIDSHWLLFIARGLIALAFGAVALFNMRRDVSYMITLVGIFLLTFSIVEFVNALYRACSPEDRLGHFRFTRHHRRSRCARTALHYHSRFSLAPLHHRRLHLPSRLLRNYRGLPRHCRPDRPLHLDFQRHVWRHLWHHRLQFWRIFRTLLRRLSLNRRYM